MCSIPGLHLLDMESQGKFSIRKSGFQFRMLDGAIEWQCGESTGADETSSRKIDEQTSTPGGKGYNEDETFQVKMMKG